MFAVKIVNFFHKIFRKYFLSQPQKFSLDNNLTNYMRTIYLNYIHARRALFDKISLYWKFEWSNIWILGVLWLSGMIFLIMKFRINGHDAHMCTWYICMDIEGAQNIRLLIEYLEACIYLTRRCRRIFASISEVHNSTIQISAEACE